jgi:hypothetical protein
MAFAVASNTVSNVLPSGMGNTPHQCCLVAGRGADSSVNGLSVGTALYLGPIREIHLEHRMSKGHKPSAMAYCFGGLS